MMATYIGWETATSLMLAYETLAINHKKVMRTEEKEPTTGEPKPYFKYKNAFALLILNASIVEGTVRTIVSERVKSDLDNAIKRGIQEGRTEHDSPTRLLAKFLVELESNGSWSSLTSSTVAYFGTKIDADVTSNVCEGIEKLFVLRNVLAHGTALIQPKDKMSDDMKDVYPFNWQSKLHGVGMYLEKHLKRGGVFENLAHPDCPEHFMNITKQYLSEIATKWAPLPHRAENTIKMIKSYNFGTLNWHG